MKRQFLFRKIYIAILLLLAVLLAAGCAEQPPAGESSSQEPATESGESSEEDSGFSEIVLSEDPAESSEEPYDPNAFYPYRPDGEPTFDGKPLQTALPVTGVTFLPDAVEGEVGETLLLPWECRPRTAKPASLQFTSDNPAVATVDETGRAHLLSAGKAKITVTADGKRATCTLTVFPKSAPTPLSERLSAIVGEKDCRLFRFGLLDVDGDGKQELIAQCFATESGVPFAEVCRVETGEVLFSAECGAIAEKWSVRGGKYASRFVYVAHTQYPSMSGAQVCRDAVMFEAQSGQWKLTRLSRRTMSTRGTYDYCVNADGTLVSCDLSTYQYYVKEESVSQFERDNPASETALLVSGGSVSEVVRLLTAPKE